jgi:hypothetical protein
VDGPLEVTWRRHDGKYYYVVLNMSGRSLSGQKITLHGPGNTGSARVHDEGRSETISNGVITDDFGAYDVHVYIVDAPASPKAATAQRAAAAGSSLTTSAVGSEPLAGALPAPSAFSDRAMELEEDDDILS